MTDVEQLARNVEAGDRRALARAITLIESTRPDHREAAEALVARFAAPPRDAFRIGISGAPGVGKSTFIEAFGLHLAELGKRVAVLAVDPSSCRSGGSILGDKTRMPELARSPASFIRPSPAGVTLGGVARRTREAMLAVEAVGFEVVVVETVGVGQSETAVEDMVDVFLLLLAPGGGDDLQGIKRGVMELADLIVVNKADGDLARAARVAAGDFRNALALMRPKTPHWRPKVLLASALNKTGVAEVWAALCEYRDVLKGAGALESRRAAQRLRWLWAEVEAGLVEALRGDPLVGERAADLEAQVRAGRLAPPAAARALLAAFLGTKTKERSQS
jgi:LAO/AO transport system kinase